MWEHAATNWILLTLALSAQAARSLLPPTPTTSQHIIKFCFHSLLPSSDLRDHPAPAASDPSCLKSHSVRPLPFRRLFVSMMQELLRSCLSEGETPPPPPSSWPTCSTLRLERWPLLMARQPSLKLHPLPSTTKASIFMKPLQFS